MLVCYATILLFLMLALNMKLKAGSLSYSTLPNLRGISRWSRSENGWLSAHIFLAVSPDSTLRCVASANDIAQAVLSLAEFLICTIVSFAMATDDLRPSRAVWPSFNTKSSWSEGVQFVISLSAPVLAFCPVDRAVHSIEAKNARRI